MRNLAIAVLQFFYVATTDCGVGNGLFTPEIMDRTSGPSKWTPLYYVNHETETRKVVSLQRNLGLRGGESDALRTKTLTTDIGCGKCITCSGKCTSCGKPKVVLSPDFLELGSVLGHGSFSTVHLATSARWGPVAVKKVRTIIFFGEK
jgi:hypothetical protein